MLYVILNERKRTAPKAKLHTWQRGEYFTGLHSRHTQLGEPAKRERDRQQKLWRPESDDWRPRLASEKAEERGAPVATLGTG